MLAVNYTYHITQKMKTFNKKLNIKNKKLKK